MKIIQIISHNDGIYGLGDDGEIYRKQNDLSGYMVPFWEHLYMDGYSK